MVETSGFTCFTGTATAFGDGRLACSTGGHKAPPLYRQIAFGLGQHAKGLRDDLYCLLFLLSRETDVIRNA